MKKLIAILILWSPVAWSFPEMVRHGYTQCTACHVSPTGGGLLTSYGRELSGDLLSTWSSGNEVQFLHSSVGKKLSDKGILTGGDIRWLQYRYKDANTLDGKFFLMHADFQAAYQVEHFTGVISVGEIENPTDKVFRGNFYSAEYYAFIHFTDELGIRAGRFVPAYGINFPDHTLVVKQGLITGQPLQKYDTVEASYLSEHWTVLATASQTTPNTQPSDQETIRTASVSYSFLERFRVGVSYWGGKGPTLNRHVYGTNAILGFTKHFYNLTEIDFKNESTIDGIYAMSRLAYEVYKGINPYLQFQQQQTDVSDKSTREMHYGAGLSVFPRPHFEITGEWDYIMQTASQYADSSWLLLHYYF